MCVMISPGGYRGLGDFTFMGVRILWIWYGTDLDIGNTYLSSMRSVSHMDCR